MTWGKVISHQASLESSRDTPCLVCVLRVYLKPSLKLVSVGMPVPPPPPGEDNPDLYIPDIVKQFITHFYTQVVDKVCVCQCILYEQALLARNFV